MPQWHHLRLLLLHAKSVVTYVCAYFLPSLCTVQPGSAHTFGRTTPESNNTADTTSMLPDLDVQASSKTSLCASPLPTDTASPIEKPIMTREMSQDLDHEVVGSSGPAGLVHLDNLAVSGQYPDDIEEPSELAPEGLSDASAPRPPFHSENAVTLTISQQGEF